VYWHEGKAYVVGQPGHEYQITVANRVGADILAVVSVDGVTAISGETASPDQTGYVLPPWQSTEINGWRKSLDDVAQFVFTDLPDSYAARTGRPDNVGVIGVAAFRERRRYIPVPMTAPPVADAMREQAASKARNGAAPPSAPTAEAAADSAYGGIARQSIGTGHGRLIFFQTNEVFKHQRVHIGEHKAAIRFFGAAYDRLASNVKGRVHNNAAAGQLFKRIDDLIVTRAPR
jgi:hypothetical protein